MKRLLAITTLILALLVPAACNNVNALTSQPVSTFVSTVVTTAAHTVTTTSTGITSTTATMPIQTTVTVTSPQTTGAGETATASTEIALKGASVTVTGAGAAAAGSKVTITAAGLYNIGGTLTDGQIIVSAPDDAKVILVFNGVNITCSNNAPVYVKSADKVTITLASGTSNSVIDGTVYVLEDTASEEPSAAIFSNDDLTINGSGSLTIKANYNHGIQSKDDLKINGGNVTVTSKNDALKGRDSVTVKDATITIKSGGDGIQSNNDEEPEKGFVIIESGTINITSGEDGIQAETTLTFSGGSVTVKSGGGSTVMKNENISSKGLKAGVALVIDGGTIKIDSSDDCLHSNKSITVNGGTITMATADDAVHADESITVNGGDITITKCYEGFESKTVTMNSGNVHLVSSDDGVNGVSSNTVAGQLGNPFGGAGNSSLSINGGYLYVDSGGDGIDINGAITMTGGTVIINGPTNNMNGALDFSSFKITGGLLIAVGSSGMAQAPGNTSTQYSLAVNLTSTMAAGTLVNIQDASGNDILTLKPAKNYQSVVISSPDIQRGATLSVYTGGSSTGTVKDSLYTGGKYTAGTKAYTLTVSNVTTTAGSGGMGPGGGRP
jgi:hypothetical protein